MTPRILLVDDDPDQLSIRSLLLSTRGFTSFQAADSESALRIAKLEHPNCAVVDLRLPTERDGLRLIQQLGSLNPEMKILLLTGRSIAHLEGRPELQAVKAVIEKGSPSNLLLQAVQQFCHPAAETS